MNKFVVSNASFSKNYIYFLLLGFFILNILVKFYYLPEESLYGDEAYSIFQAQKNLHELRDIFLYDQNAPFYLIALHFWFKIAGVSALSAKGFSVLFSVFSAIVFFLFAKRFVNHQAAIIVSVLFLLSNAQLFYSHEARTYALIQFLCITSFYAYFSVLNDPKIKALLALFFINSLLIYSHYLTIFIFVTQFFCSFLFVKENLKGFRYYVFSQILTLLAFLPWLNVMMRNMPQDGSFWLEKPDFNDLKAFVWMINGNEFLFVLFSFIILSSTVMIFLNNRSHFYNPYFKVRYYIVFLCLYILPIVLNYLVAQFTPVFLGRYFLYATFGLFLLIAYVISHLKTSGWLKLFIIILLTYSLIVSFDANPEREDDWKSVVHRVKHVQTEKTAIIISASYKYREFAYYYDFNAFRDYNNTVDLLFQSNVYCDKEGNRNWKNINIDEIDKVVFIKSHSQFEYQEEEIVNFLLENYIKCEDYLKGNLAYTVYVKKGLVCLPYTISDDKRKSKDALWHLQIGIHDETKDTILVYSTDMEFDVTDNQGAFFSSDKSTSGKYSNRIDNNFPYSVGFETPMVQITEIQIINIDANILAKTYNDARLVISIEKNMEAFFRREIFINKFVKDEDSWSKVSFTVLLPFERKVGTSLKVYFWNPSSEEVYIDDFSIALSK